MVPDPNQRLPLKEKGPHPSELDPFVAGILNLPSPAKSLRLGEAAAAPSHVDSILGSPSVDL